MSTNSIKWIAKGRKRSQSPDPVHLIEIEESDKRVKHKAGDPPFGTPIDTPLAIELIRNLWQAVNKDDLFTIRQQFKNLTNQLSSAQQDLDKEVVKKIEALANISAGWIEDLLKFSFSVTADKNILLKMLSQPGCEGIRYYLCMKKGDSNKNTRDTLSIVSVGVDIHAHDLNYEYYKNKHDLVNIPDIEDCSLKAEYKYTLGKDPFDQGTTTEDDIKPFVLFKYANSKFKYQ